MADKKYGNSRKRSRKMYESTSILKERTAKIIRNGLCKKMMVEEIFKVKDIFHLTRSMKKIVDKETRDQETKSEKVNKWSKKYKPNFQSITQHAVAATKVEEYKEFGESTSFQSSPTFKNSPAFLGRSLETLASLYYLADKYKDLVQIYLPQSFGGIRDASITWYSKMKNSGPFFPVELIKLISPSLSSGALDKRRRFIIFPVQLFKTENDTLYHANILIYDTEKKFVERFEPYGHSSESYSESEEFDFLLKYEHGRLDNELTDFFKHYDVEYRSSLSICPASSFQQLEESFEEYKIGDPRGFCVAYCLLYVDARLSNPDIPSNILFNLLMEGIQEGTQVPLPSEGTKVPLPSYLSSSSGCSDGRRNNRGSGHSFRDFIRNYSNSILKKGLEIVDKDKVNEDEKWTKIIESRRKRGIIVCSGNPWDVENFSHKLVDTRKRRPTSDKESRNEENYRQKELGSITEIKMSVVTNQKFVKTYSDAVEKIKSFIKVYSLMKVSTLIFVGEHRWLGEDENYLRDLFENIDDDDHGQQQYCNQISKYYLAAPALEDNNIDTPIAPVSSLIEDEKDEKVEKVEKDNKPAPVLDISVKMLSHISNLLFERRVDDWKLEDRGWLVGCLKRLQPPVDQDNRDDQDKQNRYTIESILNVACTHYSSDEYSSLFKNIGDVKFIDPVFLKLEVNYAILALEKIWEQGYSDPIDYARRHPIYYQYSLFSAKEQGYIVLNKETDVERLYQSAF